MTTIAKNQSNILVPPFSSIVPTSYGCSNGDFFITRYGSFNEESFFGEEKENYYGNSSEIVYKGDFTTEDVIEHMFAVKSLKISYNLEVNYNKTLQDGLTSNFNHEIRIYFTYLNIDVSETDENNFPIILPYARCCLPPYNAQTQIKNYQTQANQIQGVSFGFHPLNIGLSDVRLDNRDENGSIYRGYTNQEYANPIIETALRVFSRFSRVRVFDPSTGAGFSLRTAIGVEYRKVPTIIKVLGQEIETQCDFDPNAYIYPIFDNYVSGSATFEFDYFDFQT